MIGIEAIYRIIGAFLVVAAAMNLRDRSLARAGFWAVLAMPFLAGHAILDADAAGTRWPTQAMGVGVIVLGVLAARGPARARSDPAGARREREVSAAKLGSRLFVPALAIPVATVAIALGARWLAWDGAPLIESGHETLIGLGLACLVALAIGIAITRRPFGDSMVEGRRLLDALGWAALLPMLLATLGSVFAATGVGDAIAAIVGAVIPADSRMACLAVFAFGMVMFTIIMGNAFAAFPVMMTGVGLPLLIVRHHADPAVLGAIGMLTGYCGTLLTPMAANFNIVPAVLLELRDQYGVIRMQWPTAIALMAVNLILLAMLVFR